MSDALVTPAAATEVSKYSQQEWTNPRSIVKC